MVIVFARETLPLALSLLLALCVISGNL